MKKIIGIFSFVCFTSCYFGANETGNEITNDFYLIGWDEKAWQITFSLDDQIYDSEKIVIDHDVFAVGHNDDFIIAKQHPCENKAHHINDYFDSLRPNKKITNYYIIDLREEEYKIHKIPSAKKYNEMRMTLGVPKELSYKFYAKELE